MRACDGSSSHVVAQTCSTVIFSICFLQSNDSKIFDAEDSADFFAELRRLQSKTKCTEATLFEIIDAFSKYHDLEFATKSEMAKMDKKMQELAGATYLELHGCKKSRTGCGKFVFKPDDKRTRCPLCGAARFDLNGKPLEVRVVYIESFVFVCLLFIIHASLITNTESFLLPHWPQVAIVVGYTRIL